ncbi:MAG: aspartate kinase [Bacteroidetes bacterium]|nr:aspartate kinase [Bacteroidota bacterium]
MKKSIKVFKFGGASIKNSEAIKNVAGILRNYKSESLVIAVSAMGKTTNALEKVVEAHFNKSGKASDLFNEIKTNHFSLLDQLFEKDHEVYELLNDTFVEVDWVLEEEPHDNFDFMYDQIVSVGELASSRILQVYLQEQSLPTSWLDARDVILTDDIFRSSWVQWDETIQNAQEKVLPLLAENPFVLTQGFIGGTKENYTTTLGREGSDYTAAIFSFCLDAESMTIWKDVPGVLTADPRIFDNVSKIDLLSYREAIEMTYYGAKVIHPKTIKPLQNKSIPMFVKSFVNPEGSGTEITGSVEETYPPIVTIKKNQALLNIFTRDFSFVAEHHMSYLFSIIADLRLPVNIMQNTAISFAICVNDIDDKVERFVEMIKSNFEVRIERGGLELITVRHYQEDVIKSLRNGSIVLLEERIRNTVQMVVKNTPMIKRKA